MNIQLGSNDQVKPEVRFPWYVWLFAWLSASLMGGCFGAFFWILQGGGLQIAGAGFGMGFYLAALVGAVIVPVFALLVRILGMRGGKSLRMMTIAGGATGLVSGVVVGPLCLLTCALGAFGARLPGQMHLNRHVDFNPSSFAETA